MMITQIKIKGTFDHSNQTFKIEVESLFRKEMRENKHNHE